MLAEIRGYFKTFISELEGIVFNPIILKHPHQHGYFIGSIRMTLNQYISFQNIHQHFKTQISGNRNRRRFLLIIFISLFLLKVLLTIPTVIQCRIKMLSNNLVNAHTRSRLYLGSLPVNARWVFSKRKFNSLWRIFKTKSIHRAAISKL